MSLTLDNELCCFAIGNTWSMKFRIYCSVYIPTELLCFHKIVKDDVSMNASVTETLKVEISKHTIHWQTLKEIVKTLCLHMSQHHCSSLLWSIEELEVNYSWQIQRRGVYTTKYFTVNTHMKHTHTTTIWTNGAHKMSKYNHPHFDLQQYIY